MRILYKTFFIISVLFTSQQIFSYEPYDYSPIDSDYDYYSNDNDYNGSARADDNDNQYSSKKKYSKYSRYSKNSENTKSESGFTGAGKAFVFDPKQLRWYAFYNGNLVNSGRASGGRYYCSDIRRPCKTPSGVYRVGRKGGPECKSSKYPIGKGNAPMPWCMYFNGGFAIHGSWAVPNFNASHGCIRVPPQDARWLSQNFLSSGSKVIVKSY